MTLPTLPGSEHLISLALTYALHSTVLTLVALLIVRGLKPRSNPLREAIWTAALFGAFVTTAMQSAGGVSSRLATFEIERSAPRLELGATGFAPFDPFQTESAHAAMPQESAKRSLRVDSRGTESRASGSQRRSAAPVTSTATSSSEASDSAVSTVGALRDRVAERFAAITAAVRRDAGTVLLLGAVFGAIWLGWLFLRSRSALAGRIPLVDHPLNEQLDALRASFGFEHEVAISLSDRIATPVAFGVRRFEICVPERVLSDLDDSQRQAMLAHELAHLVRRDPLRLLLARAVESICFFQPLHRLARRELFEVIERRCDAYAVERLGGGLALAGCLAEVASWLVSRPARAMAPAMAESKSALCRRIEQLLDEDATLESDQRQRRLAPLVIALVPMVALVAPGFAVARPEVAVDRAATPRNDRAEIATPTPVPDPTTTERAIELDEVVELLDSEISALGEEIAELRCVLGDTKDPRFEPALDALEARLTKLEERRTSLAALWRVRELELGDMIAIEDEEADDDVRRNR